MRSAVTASVLFLMATALPVFCNQEPEPNVNSRYTVESVEISPRAEPRLSSGLLGDIRKLVGEHYDQQRVDRLVSQMGKELRGYRVIHRLAKGTRPEALRLVIDVVRSRKDQDVLLPRLVYHSRQNFSFGADLDFEASGNVFTIGMLTDNDELLERHSGFRLGYRRILAGGHVRAGFRAATWRSQWNGAIETALAEQNPQDVPGIYRTRQQVEPEVSIEVLPGVWLDAGVSIQRFQTQFPAARHESSHALISSLRLERRWDISGNAHTLEAGYHLRAATNSLGSDFAYTRHGFEAAYGLRHGKERLLATMTAGVLGGRAPLFDRFVLGNSTTLRGYNKYDVAPLGGSRMAHGSLDYRHRPFRVVYDVGTVYDRGGRARVLHSLAAGLTTGWRRESLCFLIAFPLKEGRAEPVFLLGMNF